MTALLIVGSRHWQPLQAVDELIWQVRPASIESFGTSAVARQAVTAGELLGRVVSPFTLEPIEDLVAPMDGFLAYWARSYPVNPGDWAFAVLPRDHPGTRWVSAAEF